MSDESDVVLGVDARRHLPYDAPAGDTGSSGAVAESGGLRRSLRSTRPLAFAAGSALVVAGSYVVAGRVDPDPWSPRTEYGLHVLALAVAGACAGLVLWAWRRGSTWGADLVPALFGGLAALTHLTALRGTPFDLNGLNGDQSFRTAAVTHFADTWHLIDYSYQGLPAFYAPGYFWVLGRSAAVLGLEPWHMLKYGAIGVAFAAPVLSYLLWRRHLDARVAALVAAVPLVVPDITEAYGWIVQVAIVPWWLEAVHDLRRPGVKRLHPVVLGLIGSLLFYTYYYYFFLFVIVFPLFEIVEWKFGRFDRRRVLRGLGVLGIAALGASAYWGPLLWNALTTVEFRPLNNRWLTAHSGDLALPMLEPTVLGALCLLGLGYLAWTYREPLSRALLIVLASLYLWHALGYAVLFVDKPLMSFRMKTLVPIVLLTASGIALARLVRYAMVWFGEDRFTRQQVRLMATAGAAMLAVFVSDGYVTKILDHEWTRAAHNQTLPDGRLPEFHASDAKPVRPAAAAIRHALRDGVGDGVRMTILSDRTDLYAYYPYFSFVQYNANYSHPAAEYRKRLAFLDDLSRVPGPAEFAARCRVNPFGRIDALVLRVEGDALTFTTYDDAFPYGTSRRQVVIPKRLVDAEHFRIATVHGYLIATVRR